MRSLLALNVFLIVLCVYPANSISRWFSATYNDLKFTLYRYGHCYNGLQPLSSSSLNETEFLVNQIRTFLDQANFDNEQLANVSALMDNICRPNIDTSYPISVHIDVNKFGNNYPAGKENRCNAIDDAMDSMYYVFRRAALNRSEPLDFSVIQFYPNETDRTATYNLTDLINTSWIKSETILEHVCGITNATKEYVQARTSNSSAQARSEQAGRAGLMNALVEYINRLLDPILGLQKRLYWEGANRFGQFSSRVSSGLGGVRDGIGAGLGRTRQRLFGARTNSTTKSALNSTTLNSTTSFPSTTPVPVSKSTTSSVVYASSTTIQAPVTSTGPSGSTNTMSN